MKIPFWATVFTILGMTILCALGIWQLQRLTLKNELLAQIGQVYAQDAEKTSLMLEDFKIQEGFKRGFVEGVFLHDHEILIRPRIHEGRVGYHVITPFLIDGNQSLILINRGWIPVESEMPKDKAIQRPNDKVKISGIVRRPSSGNWFTPLNEPERGGWYRIDAGEIYKAQGLSGTGPAILYVENGNREDFPLPQGTKITLSNNHAQYALFWFAMAGVLGGIYCFRFLLKRL